MKGSNGTIYAIGDCAVVEQEKITESIDEWFKKADKDFDGSLDIDEFTGKSKIFWKDTSKQTQTYFYTYINLYWFVYTSVLKVILAIFSYNGTSQREISSSVFLLHICMENVDKKVGFANIFYTLEG